MKTLDSVGIKELTANGGMKYQNQSHFSKSNNKRKTKEPERGKHMGSASHNKLFSTASSPTVKRDEFFKKMQGENPLNVLNRNAPFSYFSHPIGSTSTMLRYPAATNVATTFVVPASQFPSFTNRNYSHYGYLDPVYNRNQLSGLDAGRPFHPYISGARTYGHKGYNIFLFYFRIARLELCMLTHFR
ncbi:hypothetical protein M0R45_004428 [Rubus argutus]|uniref:Uncharacterized protein n=1 Tax=Rubus argutus TaxID=59490 RepID=A0AAW1YJQ9_RUBAR